MSAVRFALVLCLFALAGCDLPQERLVCTNAEGRVTFRSVASAAWKMSLQGVWTSTPIEDAQYRQSAFESCHTEAVQ